MPDHDSISDAEATPEAGHEPEMPLLRVVKGDPSAEELAALVSVVSAMAAGAQAATGKAKPRPEWSSHHRRLRGTLRHGPGAWRAGAR